MVPAIALWTDEITVFTRFQTIVTNVIINRPTHNLAVCLHSNVINIFYKNTEAVAIL